MNPPATQYEQIEMLAERLSPGDKVRLIEKLTRALDREYVAQLPKAPGWPPGFIERTYGSLADDPIERPPQGELEDRDP
ncbi:MAG: hypothetical protein KME04_17855 [Pleurocapsa minor GSE-CHR-MK-17-07R]|jgi:hypothetical protein|nr:hypothetical protein [Pleurocapsa minor GSE-CHR-MK 17-07R]